MPAVTKKEWMKKKKDLRAKELAKRAELAKALKALKIWRKKQIWEKELEKVNAAIGRLEEKKLYVLERLIKKFEQKAMLLSRLAWLNSG